MIRHVCFVLGHGLYTEQDIRTLEGDEEPFLAFLFSFQTTKVYGNNHQKWPLRAMPRMESSSPPPLTLSRKLNHYHSAMYVALDDVVYLNGDRKVDGNDVRYSELKFYISSVVFFCSSSGQIFWVPHPHCRIFSSTLARRVSSSSSSVSTSPSLFPRASTLSIFFSRHEIARDIKLT